MSAATNPAARPLPQSWRLLGSVLAVGHLALIGLYALAAPSGPWQFNIGSRSGVSMADGPAFARTLSEHVTEPYFLYPLRMTHNYHFSSDRHADFAVYFEVHLTKADGNVVHRKFPDDKANLWVRHRQQLLAQNLVPDQRLPPRGNVRLPAPGKELPKVEIWFRDEPMTLRVKRVDENDDILRSPVVDQPSPWAKALVKSYLRYLCREHNAVKGELIRVSRPTVHPTDLIAPRPAEEFKELRSHFEEYRREE
ncbi:MAG: hypothetical protein FJ303_14310 [Planctomycetes bacterium]|nr:hypothetical protein [Planctomycetota bacterium]